MSPEDRKKALFWSQTNVGIAGDVGPFTVWTTQRGKVVWIKRAPPDKPASDRQRQQRLRFRLAWMNWKAEPEEVKEKWRAIISHTQICMSAHNLYMALAMNPDYPGLKNRADAAGVEVEHPTYLPP